MSEPLGRMELFARLGRITVAETMLNQAVKAQAEREWRNRIDDSPHGGAWFSSMHVSSFPGDDSRACERQLLYEMMGFAHSEVLPQRVYSAGAMGIGIERWETDLFEFDGRLLSAGNSAKHGVGFEDADHWLTGSPDLVVLPKFWNRPLVIECLDGDTLVAVADGRNAVSIRQLAEEGNSVDVYASIGGKTVVRKMDNIRKTRQNAKMVRVEFDDGSSLRCTDDHLILLRDGTYCEAQLLRPGTSAMRFDSELVPYLGSNTLRRRIWLGPNGGSNCARGASWAWQYQWSGKRLFGDRYFRGSGMCVHHVDENPLNDRYDNLELLTRSGHSALHANTQEERARRSEQMTRLWSDMSDEDRSEMLDRRNASIDREAHGRVVHAQLAAMTEDERLERTRAARESMTSDQRSEKMRAMWASMTPEERAERARKSRDARLAKAQNHKVVGVYSDGFADTYCGHVEEAENFAVVTSNAGGNLSGVVVHNCKGDKLERVEEMRSFKRSYWPKHARQCRGYVGMGARVSREIWPAAVVCRHTWRLALHQSAVGGKYPGERPELICRDHGAYSDCLREIELQPINSGVLLYSARDNPEVRASYYFEHDEQWFQQGLATLRRVQEHYVKDELPSHPFGGKQWSAPPCNYCNHKRSTCKPDHQAGTTKLSESHGVEWSQEVFGHYNPQWVRQQVLERWRGREGYSYTLPPGYEAGRYGIQKSDMLVNR